MESVSTDTPIETLPRVPAAVPATENAGDGAWSKYYRDSARRRRARGGQRQLREAKRRRRLRERLGLGLSVLLVSGMTAIFYLVLR